MSILSQINLRYIYSCNENNDSNIFSCFINATKKISIFVLSLALFFFNAETISACFTKDQIQSAQAQLDADTAVEKNLKTAYENASKYAATTAASVAALARQAADAATQLASAITNLQAARQAYANAPQSLGVAALLALAEAVAQASEAEILAAGLVTSVGVLLATAEAAADIAAIAVTAAAIAFAAAAAAVAVDNAILQYELSHACCNS